MTRYRGLVWRHVPVGAEPLHLGYILKATRGRWNTRRPRLPCLYTALTPEGAIAELDKHAEAFAGRRRRRDLVSLRVDVDNILDLTAAGTRARLRAPKAVLTGDEPGDLVFCRALARREVLHGRYDAILAPSAALRGGVNLMIYTVRTDHIHELANGPDRVTITPGYRWPRPAA